MTSTPPPAIRAVIGTAGHVDHGKTTLVTQLTGIDTDRLSEEKTRGISIELGFAWLDLPDAGRVAIIDVPGHERFVRQMIAGAAGVDLVLLVVAADEGVMPQTREHLDICQLLGVRAGAIAITKSDLVDEEWLELVRDDIATAVAGTFLEGAPMVAFSALDPATQDDVRSCLTDVIADADRRGLLATRSESRPFKLSVDRAFTMKGFGTIVTGTTAAGRLSIGDAVQLLPGEVASRVRGIQVHGAAVDTVGPGTRAAINLQGVDHTDVHRGDVLCHAGALRTTSMIDATFRALPRLDAPVADRTKVLVHVGTAQVEATLALIGTEAAYPGEQVPAQLRLARPTPMLAGEPYVARGFAVLEGYGKTIGGGRAWLAQERRHRRGDTAAATLITELSSGDAGRALLGLLRFAGDQGRVSAELAASLPLTADDVTAALAAAVADGGAFEAGDRVYASAGIAHVEAALDSVLADYHAAHPARSGLAAEELRTRARADLPPALIQTILERAVAAGRVARAGLLYRRADFSPSRSAQQDAAVAALLGALEAGGLMPPRLADLPEALDLPVSQVDEAIVFCAEDGLVVRVSRELVFHRGALDALQAQIRAHFAAHDTLDTATFKTMTGASRKWTIPLGEYFDKQRLTVRSGEIRKLRRS